MDFLNGVVRKLAQFPSVRQRPVAKGVAFVLDSKQRIAVYDH